MDEALRASAVRCVGCSIPRCRDEGCLLGNDIPQFVEQVLHERWEEACQTLHAVNNFPEFTGRVCASPCESACVHHRHGQPAPVHQFECAVMEQAFVEGWIRPVLPARRSGHKVAVFGSGPAGLTVSQQLARAGHTVSLFDRDDQAGGVLRHGTAACPLDPVLIERRLEQLIAEGVCILTGFVVGRDISGRYLHRDFEAICLAIDSADLPAAGGILAELGLELDRQGRLPIHAHRTVDPQIFAVDDVTTDLPRLALAIRRGREAAAVIDQMLAGGVGR